MKASRLLSILYLLLCVALLSCNSDLSEGNFLKDSESVAAENAAKSAQKLYNGMDVSGAKFGTATLPSSTTVTISFDPSGAKVARIVFRKGVQFITKPRANSSVGKSVELFTSFSVTCSCPGSSGCDPAYDPQTKKFNCINPCQGTCFVERSPIPDVDLDGGFFLDSSEGFTMVSGKNQKSTTYSKTLKYDTSSYPEWFWEVAPNREYHKFYKEKYGVPPPYGLSPEETKTKYGKYKIVKVYFAGMEAFVLAPNTNLSKDATISIDDNTGEPTCKCGNGGNEGCTLKYANGIYYCKRETDKCFSCCITTGQPCP